jgi:hypothetical protein
MTRSPHFLLRLVGLAAAALVPASALAQTPAPAAPAPAPAPAGPTPGSTYVPTPNGSQTFTYGPNTQSPNGTIGGGNATESSAHPVTGDQEDGFDYGNSGNHQGAVHGDDNGPVFIGGHGAGGDVPYSHLVRRGDTLWGICGEYFENPYQWPRVWSYNPQIKNPHWIYPGDEVHLRDMTGASATPGLPTANVPLPYQQQTLVDRRRQVPSGTVFLRDQGWIHDDADEVWGDVTGSSTETMFLTQGNEIYLHIDKGHEVTLGQELTLFKPVKSAAAGTLVQIEGTARIDAWNAQDRVARAQIVESLNVVERGTRVGPLTRKFAIVPPVRNEVEVQAHVLVSIHPEEFWGQNAVVFIDKGEAAGLKPGNMLQIIRRGDAWRRTLVTPAAGWRVSPEDETPAPALEKTPGSRKDEEAYPDEVIGELRVVSTRKDSSACLVTKSLHEIEPFELAVARKGYQGEAN